MFDVIDNDKVRSYSVAKRANIEKLPTNTKRGTQESINNDSINDICDLGSDAMVGEDGSVWILFPKENSLEGEWIEQ